jgi:hypothetical protein
MRLETEMDVTINLRGLTEPTNNKMAAETVDNPRSILLFRAAGMGEGHLLLWGNRAEVRDFAYRLLKASDDGGLEVTGE